MYSIVDVYTLRDRPQKGNLKKSEIDTTVKEVGIERTENFSRDEESFLETYSVINEVATIPAKISILHTRKESIILKSEEDPVESWYFTRI